MRSCTTAVHVEPLSQVNFGQGCKEPQACLIQLARSCCGTQATFPIKYDSEKPARGNTAGIKKLDSMVTNLIKRLRGAGWVAPFCILVWGQVGLWIAHGV